MSQDSSLPVVNFSVDKTTIVEGGEAQILTFNLSEPAPSGGLVVNIRVDDPDGDPGAGDTTFPPEFISNITDFGQVEENGITTASVTIAEGSSEATFGIVAFEDDLVEVGETYSFTLLEDENYIVDSASTTITTSIEDFMKPTVSITPETISSTEGNTFAWKFTLDKPVPSGGLTLSLPITQNNDPAPGDVNYFVDGSTGITDFSFLVGDDVSLGFTVTLAEGVTEAILVSEAVADGVAESDEIFTTVLADGKDYTANPDSNQVTTVISDETIVTFTPEQVSVAEGNTFAWNFSLNKPAPAGGLTLNLPITQNNDPAAGDVDYNVDGSSNISDFGFLTQDDVSLGFSITIAEGETEAKLVSQAVTDGIAEGDEIFTTVLADGENYRANPLNSEVVTTISDTSTDLPTLAISAEPTNVNEGEQLKFNFELTEAAPSGGLTVNLDLVEDTDPLPGDITYFVDGSENVTDFELLVNDDTGLIDGATVTIAEGATSATLLNDIIADNNTEGLESVKFGLASGDYSIDSQDNAASFTIVDTSTDLPTLSLSAEPNQVNEGEQLKFNFELTEAAPSGGLTVNLDLVEDTDPLPGDITYEVEGSENITGFELLVDEDTGLIDGATVTIAEGATSATLLNDIIADNNTEGLESVKFGLASGDYSIDSQDNAASFTIVDTSTDLPTLSLSAEPNQVNEGEQLKFNFELTEAAPSGGLTVNLDLVEDTDPLPGDITYEVEGSENITGFELLVDEDTGLIDGATVTIAEGATSATLLNDIIADNNTEGLESVKFGLANGDYSIDSEDNAASFTIVDTSLSNEISGTTGDDNLYGTNASEIISGGRGDDNISGNGGGDTLIGGRGDDDIYGSFEADEISGGRGDDFIFGNGGNDLIDSGMGFDTVFLGAQEATVILDKGQGFDTIFNFQLGATKFEVSSLDNLSFTDGDSGAEIFLEGDKLAVVAGQSANTFSSSQDMIFAV